MSNEEYQEIKLHPRMLELRIALYYSSFVKEYGVNKTIEFMRTICLLVDADFQKINGILNQMPKIRYMEKTNKERYRQELVFLGTIYGESKYFIAKNILHLVPNALYRKRYQLDPEVYVTKQWLEKLDDSVAVCGIPQYALEARRFINAFEAFVETVNRVSTPKTTLY